MKVIEGFQNGFLKAVRKETANEKPTSFSKNDQSITADLKYFEDVSDMIQRIDELLRKLSTTRELITRLK